MRTRTRLLLGGCVVAGASLFLALVAAIAAPRLGQSLGEQASRLSLERTGLPLSFARPPAVSFLPPGLRFEAASWGGDREGFSLTARGGFAGIDILSLVRGIPSLRELRLEAPVLRRAAAAAHTAPALAAPPSPAGAASPQEGRDQGTAKDRPVPEIPALVQRLPLRVTRLIVSDGAVIHERDDGTRWEMGGVHLTFQTPGRSTISDLLCDFTLRHRQAGGGLSETNVALQAAIQASLPRVVLSQCRFTLTPLAGLWPRDMGPMRVSLTGGVDLGAMTFHVDRGAIDIAQTGLDVRGRGRLAPLSFEGRASLDARASALARLPLPLQGVRRLRLSGQATLLGGVLHLPAFTGQVDDTSLDGFLAVATAPLRVRAGVHASHVDLDRLLGGWQAARQPAGALPQFAAGSPAARGGGLQALDLRLSADGGTWRELELTELKMAISGREGRYQAEHVIARTARGGLVSARGSYDVPADRWTSAGEAWSVPLTPLLRAAGLLPGGDEAPSPTEDRATVTAQWELAGHGGDLESVLRGMSGSGRVVLRRMGTGAIRRALRRHSQWNDLPATIGRVKAPFTVSQGMGKWEADLAGDRLSGTASGTFDTARRALDASLRLDVLGVCLPLAITGGHGRVDAAVDGTALRAQLGGLGGRSRARALSTAERRMLLPLLPAGERRRFR